ncbi:hypothetical protein ACSFA2_20890 [Variovorax sp. LT2P21]|uniref:hypothetical protein n=1 Tax=Variovorax sp. LT2P21 TaxID=3443731 RepID=UPI003F46BB83
MNAPFYGDWTFWAFASSMLAIVLSQAPPIAKWFGKPKLVVDYPPQMRITHAAGFATVGLVLNIRNTGSKSARVSSLAIKLRRDGVDFLEVPFTEFYPDHRVAQTQILMPFTIQAGGEYSMSLNAYEKLERDEDRRISQLASRVRLDIGKKAEAAQAKSQREGKPQELVLLDQGLLEEAMSIFKSRFRWKAGNYDVEMLVRNDEGAELKQQRVVFTLWEPDELELRALADDYQYGFGIGIGSERHGNGVFVSLRKS